ncbi:TonB-dependent receptor [Pyxidicoccus sp. 3LG]
MRVRLPSPHGPWVTRLLLALLALPPSSWAQTPDGGTDADASSTDSPQAGTVVTGTRLPRPIRDVPATTVVIPRAEIERSPTLTQDALVRTLPSANTFRRTPSLVSDPTAQGLNLRGLGPSGVARSLVLLDGLPVNDPFGGWIFWRSLPRLGLERIEVVPSGSSALYGSGALGGVVQLVSRPITGPSLEADLSVGNLDTGHLAARAAERWGPSAPRWRRSCSPATATPSSSPRSEAPSTRPRPATTPCSMAAWRRTPRTP